MWILVWKQRRVFVDLFQSLVLGLGGCIECLKFSLGFLELSVIGRERSFWTGTPSFVGHIEEVLPEICQKQKKDVTYNRRAFQKYVRLFTVAPPLVRKKNNTMARHSVAVAAVLIHTLLGIVCAMPGLGAPRAGPGRCIQVQCPGCNQGFKSHKAVRIHQNRMGPSSECFADQRDPVPSAWSSRGGGRAAGRVEGPGGGGGRLPGLGDSDSESDPGRSQRRTNQDDPAAPASDPVDPDADPAAEPPAADPPADPADFMEVYTCIYVHIQSYTYINVRIHAYTCIYNYIRTYTCDEWRLGEIMSFQYCIYRALRLVVMSDIYTSVTGCVSFTLQVYVLRQKYKLLFLWSYVGLLMLPCSTDRLCALCNTNQAVQYILRIQSAR